MIVHRLLRHFVFLVIMISGCLFAPVSFANGVGTIMNLSGEVSILVPRHKQRTPVKGTQLYQGETIVTGKNGKIEVRFTDESIVQLQPLSKFRIDEYSFAGKSDSKAKGFFSLLKGGMRTITGLIGKVNRPGYGVSTGAATIGIRGTEYSANLKNGLHVTVERGEISLTNRAGSFAILEGQNAFVKNRSAAPQYSQTGVTGQSGSPPSGTQTEGSNKTKIHGNISIDASTSNTTAIAVGKGNTAANQAGVVGGK